MPIEILECYKFFNMINNNHPVYYVDIRSHDSIVKSSHIILSKSYKIIKNIENTITIDDIANNLRNIDTIMSNITLILLIDSTINNHSLTSLYQSIESFIQISINSKDNNSNILSRIRNVSCLYMNEAIRRYSRCKDIFHIKNDIENVIYPSTYPNHPTEIIQGFLYLGDYINGTNKDSLEALDIRYIVDATGCKLSMNTAESMNIHYLPIKIEDNENVDIASHFSIVFQFIKQAMQENRAVLIHCRAGISRSATFVMAYLLYSKTFNNLLDIVKYVVNERGQVCPNVGFRRQLLDYEISLFGKSSFPNGDDDFLLCLSSYSCMWSQSLSETSFDRIPIKSINSSSNNTFIEYEDSSEKSNSTIKPKKPYLKKKSGKYIN